MEEINNVCNVQSEIMFVGALYKSPDLYVTYGNFMRPKYDFSFINVLKLTILNFPKQLMKQS